MLQIFFMNCTQSQSVNVPTQYNAASNMLTYELKSCYIGPNCSIHSDILPSKPFAPTLMSIAMLWSRFSTGNVISYISCKIMFHEHINLLQEFYPAQRSHSFCLLLLLQPIPHSESHELWNSPFFNCSYDDFCRRICIYSIRRKKYAACYRSRRKEVEVGWICIYVTY